MNNNQAQEEEEIDRRARSRVKKKVNLLQLSDKLKKPLTADSEPDEEGFINVVSADGSLTQAELDQAITEHVADPLYGLTTEQQTLYKLRNRAIEVLNLKTARFSEQESHDILAALVILNTMQEVNL